MAAEPARCFVTLVIENLSSVLHVVLLLLVELVGVCAAHNPQLGVE